MEHDDPELLQADVEERMDKAVSVAGDNLAKIRTGRASTTLVEGLLVDYYGAATPLIQLATLSTPDARTITIQPFDPGSTQAIEKAVSQSDLGLTPNVSGEGNNRIIRINIPDLSEERRKELVRVARNEAENGRVAVRNLRREANDGIKPLEKAGEISEDDAHRFLDNIQESTDQHIAKIDSLLEQKEADLLKV